jgi:hypothetical protein
VDISRVRLLAIGVGGVGCDPGGASGATPSAQAVNLKSCGPDGLIDDAEDNNNRVAVVSGRGGYWYTYTDKLQSTILPAPGGTYTMSPGGANGSKYAANMKGKIGGADQPPLYLSVGMGTGFTDPRATYDASKYKGIAFWAKKGAGSTGKVRLKVPGREHGPSGQGLHRRLLQRFRRGSRPHRHVDEILVRLEGFGPAGRLGLAQPAGDHRVEALRDSVPGERAGWDRRADRSAPLEGDLCTRTR